MSTFFRFSAPCHLSCSKRRIKSARSRPLLLALVLSCVVSLNVRAQLINTVAGGVSVETLRAPSAELSIPADVKLDAAGNLYISEPLNNRIRKVDAVTQRITTLAGTGTASFSGDDGPATLATLNSPGGIALDSSGNLYIADLSNGRIRRVDAATGIITTVAGGGAFDPLAVSGPATSAFLNGPSAVAVDPDGNIYIAELAGRVRRVDASTQIITSIAGTGQQGFSGDGGPAINATLNVPEDLAVSSSGQLYIADTLNFRVRRVDLATNIITTVAGGEGDSGDGGPAGLARLQQVLGVAVDAAGNLFISDTFNNVIRRVDTATNTISTFAGNRSGGFGGDGEAATLALLSQPRGVAVDALGNLYVADTLNHRVRRVDGVTKIITTVAGNGSIGDGGPATEALLLKPSSVAADSSGSLYIADSSNERVRRIDAVTKTITTIAPTGAPDLSFVPQGVAVDAFGTVYIADSFNSVIRRVDTVPISLTIVAGNGHFGFSGDFGPATDATLSLPTGIAIDRAGNLFIADSINKRVRRVDAATRIIRTVAGDGGFTPDGSPTAVALFSVSDVAVDAAGSIYIADPVSARILKIDAAKSVMFTVAGGGSGADLGDGGPATAARLNNPSRIAVDAEGNLYIADTDNNRIRKVDAATGIISTIAGNGTPGFSGDGGPASAASVAFPTGLTVDASGIVYFADTGNNRVRAIFPATRPRPRGARR
jgi:sugar lactone lactonase YvrE